MTTTIAPTQAASAAIKPPSPMADFLNHFCRSRGAVAGFIIMVLMTLAALFAPWIAPHDPLYQYRDAMLTPPAWAEGGRLTFLLGTDELGRDILSRLIHGGRISLLIGVVSVLLSLVPGVALGLVAAISPRRIGPVIMRIIDIMMALPSLLLAVAVMVVLGPGLINAMIAIAVVSLPAYVRLTRASAMVEFNRDYVTASRVAGAGLLRLMFIAVLPNCMAPLLIHATLSFSYAILEIAALGFLGLGVQPPTPEWGTMLASARDHITSAWWVVTMPGLTILIAVLSINLMGDGLRDALDPRLKRIA